MLPIVCVLYLTLNISTFPIQYKETIMFA